ncbi:MAG: DUF134 domain-containing protein [Melioribacteraceae bacterium]|nr:DUF134 domain-containing protein [Melioribacteraceae bacterium]
MRCLQCDPLAEYFKPRGIPLVNLEEVILELDEVEAVNLADKLGYSHEDGAKKMEVSRATFGRILKSGRKKIAEAILDGKAIRLNK